MNAGRRGRHRRHHGLRCQSFGRHRLRRTPGRGGRPRSGGIFRICGVGEGCERRVLPRIGRGCGNQRYFDGDTGLAQRRPYGGGMVHEGQDVRRAVGKPPGPRGIPSALRQVRVDATKQREASRTAQTWQKKI